MDMWTQEAMGEWDELRKWHRHISTIMCKIQS